MKSRVYLYILILQFIYCNLLGPVPPIIPSCPDYKTVWTAADSKYKTAGKIPAYALPDSFSQLSGGNRWGYFCTIYHYAANQNPTTKCGDIGFNVYQNQSNMVIIQVLNELSDPVDTIFDTLLVTNDSITNVNKDIFPYLTPVLIGPRNNIFPCFKFDDSSGYSYAKQIVVNLSGIEYSVKFVYFSKIGLVYLDYVPVVTVNNMDEYCYELLGFYDSQFNAKNHINESIAKYNYSLLDPDSIIVSALSKTSFSNVLVGLAHPFSLKPDLGWWNQNNFGNSSGDFKYSWGDISLVQNSTGHQNPYRFLIWKYGKS